MVGGVTILEGKPERLVAWRSASGDECASCGAALKRIEMTPAEARDMARWFASVDLPVTSGYVPRGGS